MNKMLLCPDTNMSPNITYSDNSSCHDMIWERGSLIEKGEYDLSRLEFVCEDLPANHFPDFAISDLGCPVVSKRLKEFFDQQKVKNIEYFPATVIEKQGMPPKEGYFAINIIGLVNCIDMEESDIEGDEEDGELVAIDYINKLVLTENSAGEIYRAYLFRRLIVVEEPLFTRLKIKNLKG